MSLCTVVPAHTLAGAQTSPKALWSQHRGGRLAAPWPPAALAELVPVTTITFQTQRGSPESDRTTARLHEDHVLWRAGVEGTPCQDSGRESRCFSCPRPPFALSTALNPEEAESALEAAHYFTEDSSSEGERSWARRPAALWGGTCLVGVLLSQGPASLWADP